MASGDKPTITGLEAGWAFNSNLVWALFNDEGSGTPVEQVSALTVSFTGDISHGTTPGGDSAVHIAASVTTLDFDVNYAHARGAGTMVFILYVNTADISNTARLLNDASDFMEIFKTGPTNTGFENGNNSTSAAFESLWETTGYKVVTVTWDNNTTAGGEGKNIYEDTTLGYTQDDDSGGQTMVAPFNIGSTNTGSSPFLDLYIVAAFGLDVVWTAANVSTFVADEWAWVSTAAGGGSVPIYSNHVTRLNNG